MGEVPALTTKLLHCVRNDESIINNDALIAKSYVANELEKLVV